MTAYFCIAIMEMKHLDSILSSLLIGKGCHILSAQQMFYDFTHY